MIEWLEQHQLPCFYHRAFGFECPGCGIQSSVIYLLKGEVAQSLLAYPALLPTVLVLMLLGVRKLMHQPVGMMVRGLLIADLALILVSWVMKLLNIL